MTVTAKGHAGAGGADSLGERFRRFYSDLHDRDPYRWQQRMATELAQGRLFDALVAPTGSGKTTFIECFLFALSEQLPAEDRTLPLRLFWVVDRRSVVDHVYEEMQALAELLAKASNGSEAERVADRLRSTISSGDGAARDGVLEVRRWRGGTERNAERLPFTTPALICSTIDQVGSRLLFRGYGTSPRSRPIDAALVGTDSLIALDEAHLAQPFGDTCAAVQRTQQAAELQTVRPAHLVRITATPPAMEKGAHRFELQANERTDDGLRSRLEARKVARLVRARKRIDALAAEASKLIADASLVGVVANTVADARSVHRKLAANHEAVLVIGPARPLDRERVMRRIVEHTDPRNNQPPTPLIVVGTQTLEVGLDLDFGALVTACAPFPSLVQRFGRLDRSGAITEREGRASAVIVGSTEKCPVYGDVVSETWDWLQSRTDADGELRFDQTMIPAHYSADPPSLQVPRAPILGPWHIEALVQTHPEPMPSPEIGYFLHDEGRSRDADVALAWRADLDPEQPHTWSERVEARPPHAAELLSLPVWTLRRWLSGRDIRANFGDIEAAQSSEPPGQNGDEGDTALPTALLVKPPGPDGEWSAELLTDPTSLAPGDVIVLSSDVGGCDEFGWAPASRAPVQDLGDLNPRRPRILLDPRARTALGTPPESLLDNQVETAEELRAERLDATEAYQLLAPRLVQWLAADDASELGKKLAEQIDVERGHVELLSTGIHRSLIVVPQPEPRRRPSSTGPVSYQDHVTAVETLAGIHAELLRLPAEIAGSVRLAARYHDLGKLDPRFQAMLNGGSPPRPGTQLAHSGARRSLWRSHASAAGWPKGKRHEMASALLVERAIESGAIDGCDNDLLVHLVVTHHGQMRPFLASDGEDDAQALKVAAEIEGTSVSVECGQVLDFMAHADRFARLVERYGPWGLAALEAALVMADRTASAGLSL